MNFWVLALSYTVHLMATAVWAAGLVLMSLLVLPAWRVGSLEKNGWLYWQKRLTPWMNGCLLLLLITGFYQMTNDPNYSGFLTIDSTWAWAMLVKHIAYIVVVISTVWLQFGLYPSMERTAILAQKRPQLASKEQALLAQKEKQLLKINIFLAAIILICTAVATAV